MQGGARAVSGRDKIEVLRQVLKIVTHPATIIAEVVSGLLFGFFCPSRPTRWCRSRNFTSHAVDEHVAHPRDGAHLGHRTDVAQRGDQRALLAHGFVLSAAADFQARRRCWYASVSGRANAWARAPPRRSASSSPTSRRSQIIGYMKGKSSIWIAQNVERKMRNFLGHKFWARGYFVTTVGRDEEVIRAYIRNQELADRQLEQFELKISAAQSSKHPLKPPLAVPNQTSSFAGGYWLTSASLRCSERRPVWDIVSFRGAA